MITNEAIADELTSINSIYGEGTFVSIATNTYSLTIPSFPSITLRLEFPTDYPDAPPSILGTQSVGEGVAKGVGSRVVDVVRNVLAEVYIPGEACVFSVLEEAREALEEASHEGTLDLYHDHAAQQEENGNKESQLLNSHGESAHDHSPSQPQSTPAIGPPPPWIVAPAMTEKKSVFLARCAPVSSPAQAKSYVQHLLATDKKAARATHNITAWRIRGPNETSYQDCDDDGETAAGGRLLHLMQLMDVWDVMVVVTRWYGGVLLGPDRFRIINSAAREAMVVGGFVAREGEGERGKKGKR